MEKLVEKLSSLKEELDQTELVNDIKKLNEEISNNSELLKLLDDYKIKPTEENKNKIIQNVLFQKYKEKETDVNLLIMEINQKLKQISNKDKWCSK
jgi:cell fate (sporulation/competence/biofilm development) regulator YmcA (YheA/YmcA/DUF963 family)